ncbi:hypothetical protein PORCRE_2096 [Porphyromonas crevioricanis JCM 15906]|uniref:Uncharacterized protein n=1 Tax=Porphyromonas crevioricanis JCM 15906 TaxID=1305617 RepID=T1CT24_9PORP|nr:hypothetical protein [Porphyromonas crevioricanis]GAD06363.1 hypothetical protein PORCRE_2096 [Porphyromonas crevioricanis JCM 15906]
MSAINDMLNNRFVPVGLHPFVHILSVEILISAHQYNRSIVSAFAHSHVRVKESRICSLIYTLAHIAHRNVILSKTHTITDIFDSANIWLGNAIISVIFLVRTCGFDLVICGFVSLNGFGDKR